VTNICFSIFFVSRFPSNRWEYREFSFRIFHCRGITHEPRNRSSKFPQKSHFCVRSFITTFRDLMDDGASGLARLPSATLEKPLALNIFFRKHHLQCSFNLRTAFCIVGRAERCVYRGFTTRFLVLLNSDPTGSVLTRRGPRDPESALLSEQLACSSNFSEVDRKSCQGIALGDFDAAKSRPWFV